ncbi:hypothetical protein GCM10027456_36260 [Kineosporia babensis]
MAWQGFRERLEHIGPGRVLGVQVLVVAVFTLLWNPLDFFIYRLGGAAIGSGTDLYLERQAGLFFTYTPFAALSFVPLNWLPLIPARLLWNLAVFAAFAWAVREMLLLARIPFSRRIFGWCVAGGLLLEPVWHTFFLGQINVFLLALVLFDVRRVAEGRGRGVGIGLGVAVAIKLTPGVFVVLLLLAGRVRAALTAGVSFAVCTLLGFAADPEASWLYWREIFFDSSRVGIPYISNQSPYGALVRLVGGRENVGEWFLLVPVVFLALGLAVATRDARRGDWASAFATAGLTSLLVSPISWAHHWVWALPALVVLVNEGRFRAASWAGAVFVLSPMWYLPRTLGPIPLLPTVNAYLVVGLALFTWLTLRSRDQGELASGMATEQELERGGSLVQGEGAGERDGEVAGVGQFDQGPAGALAEFPALRGGAADCQEPVALGAGPAGDGDDAAAVGDQVQRHVRSLVGSHRVQRRVVPLGRDLPQSLGQTLPVAHGGGAEGLHPLEVPLGRRPHDPGAQQTRLLQKAHPDRAGRAVDDDGVS